MLKFMNHNQTIGLVISSQDEQTGSVADPSSTNPYRMTIEEYFNPTPDANSRGKIVLIYITFWFNPPLHPQVIVPS